MFHTMAAFSLLPAARWVWVEFTVRPKVSEQPTNERSELVVVLWIEKLYSALFGQKLEQSCFGGNSMSLEAVENL